MGEQTSNNHSFGQYNPADDGADEQHLPHQAKSHFQRLGVAYAAATGAIVVGILGLLGYVEGLELLGSVQEGYIPMAPSTAVSFLTLGLILVLKISRSSSRFALWVFCFMSVVVTLFGGLEVLGHFVGADLNFEDALVPGAGHLDGVPIARMSPATGALFFTSGIALLALIFSAQCPRLIILTISFALLTLGISLSFAVAYAFGNPLLYGAGTTIPMALTTALAFLMLATSLIAVSRPEAFMLLAGSRKIQFDLNARQRFITLSLIMVVVCATTMAITLTMLYQHNTNLHRYQMRTTVERRARLIETLASSMSGGSDQMPDHGALDEILRETLVPILTVHEHEDGFWETGEFTLARREGDSILFVMRQRQGQFEQPEPISFDSELAEPMRLALDGNSGTLTGKDYRGETVLVAYEPVAIPGLGIVVKVDMDEIRAPFIRTGAVAAGIIFLVILIATTGFARVANPILVRLEAYTEELEQEVASRKLAEETSRKSAALLSTVLESPEEIIIFVLDLDYNYLSFNRAHAATMKKVYETDIQIGMNILSLIPPAADRQKAINDYERVLESGSFSTIDEYGLDENRTWYELFFNQLLDNDQNVIGLVCFVVDITSRKRAENQRLALERQIQHSQKLESLGVLAGGIAHDFNNLLMAVTGNADLALDKLSPMAPARDNILEIERTAKRAADLAKQMLAYSGRGKFVIEPIGICKLVEEMGHLLEVSISKKAVLKHNFSANIPTFNGDPTQIRQIVMNMITNASEAIGDRSGVISLSTGAMDCDRDYLDGLYDIMPIDLDEQLPEGMYTYFEVADTGVGIDRGDIGKIFDPFFTTKFTGRGLGMSAVLGIVRSHHGAIKVYSEVGKGTTFKVLFPANTQVLESDLGAANENGQTQWRGEGTVLIADDEDTVCSVGKQMLEHMGFKVLAATDGREAVEMYSDHASDIVCVLLDLTMPHMDGTEAFREMRRINPDVTVILCSGYSEQDATESFTGKGLAGFLQKPYSMSELKEILVEICDS